METEFALAHGGIPQPLEVTLAPFSSSAVRETHGRPELHVLVLNREDKLVRSLVGYGYIIHGDLDNGRMTP